MEFIGSAPAGVSVGGCPLCGGEVIWSDPLLPGSRSVLLDAKLVSQLSPGVGRTWVVVSGVGRPQVVEPYLFTLHICPPGVITEAIGYYSTDVLRHSCPSTMCHAYPGELCVSTRYEVMLRPHGSRVMVSGASEKNDDSVGNDDVI